MVVALEAPRSGILMRFEEGDVDGDEGEGEVEGTVAEGDID